MWLILQALEYGGKLRNELLHLQELGIATHSSLFVNANRDPNKSAPAKPSDFFYFKPSDDDCRVPTTAACVFLALIRDQKLPGWVMDVAPIDKIRQSASSNISIPEVRAWVGINVLIICPVIRDKWLQAPLYLSYRTIEGEITVEDIDRPEITHKIKVQTSDPMWAIEYETEMIEDEESVILKDLSVKKTFGRSLVD